MNIIVTGGAGFIGGNFVHMMVAKYPEDHIICVDALTYAGNLETLEPVKNKSGRSSGKSPYTSSVET